MPWVWVWILQAAPTLPAPHVPGLPALEPASTALVSVLIALLWKIYGELQLNRKETERLTRAILLDLMAHHEPSSALHQHAKAMLDELPRGNGPSALP